ncbi:MAG: hypothetical protein ACI9MC_002984 [Kiritimatiellia bacterium]|jgi:hypothetical protein
MKQRRPATPTFASAFDVASAAPEQGDAQDIVGNAAILQHVDDTQEAETSVLDTVGKATVGGHWTAPRFEEYTISDGDITSKGCSIDLEFMPNGMVDAEQIALIQTCRGMVQDTDTAAQTHEYLDDPERKRRATTDAQGGEGWHIDSNGGDVNPVYGVDTHEEGGSLTEFGEASRINHGFGRCTVSKVDGRSVVDRKPATLSDGPKLPWTEGKSYSLSFETAALCTKGPQEGSWYGSVSWGCTVDGTGKIKLDDLQVCEHGQPSAVFGHAIDSWNKDTATVSPDDNPALSKDTALKTTDLPTSGKTIDASDKALQSRALRVPFWEANAEIFRLKDERIDFVNLEKERLKTTMTDEEWLQLLRDRYDDPIAKWQAEVEALTEQIRAANKAAQPETRP